MCYGVYAASMSSLGRVAPHRSNATNQYWLCSSGHMCGDLCCLQMSDRNDFCVLVTRPRAQVRCSAIDREGTMLGVVQRTQPGAMEYCGGTSGFDGTGGKRMWIYFSVHLCHFSVHLCNSL